MKSTIRRILIEEINDLQWIKDFETKWDVSNIHLVAGKKFRFNPKMFLPHVSERIYHFKDEINPQPLKGKGPFPPPRNIEICWETATTDFNPTSMSTKSGVNTFFGSSKPSGIKCGKNSIWRVIDKLNKGEWILLDDVIKESNDLDWISDTGGNLNKIKVGAKFKSVKHLDFQTGDAGTFIIDEILWNERSLMHTEVKYNGVDYRGFKFSKWVRVKDFLRWLDDGIIVPIEDK